jgi:type II secretory pathway pseudopilin PulG
LKDKGQSVIEVLVAVVLFSIIASGAMAAIVGSWGLSRLSEERKEALRLAGEGLEAVKSLRNRDWNSLGEGDHGLVKVGSEWQFNGANDSFGKYTRVITIGPGLRAGGVIVESGGSGDEETKKVTARVNWNYTEGRPMTVQLDEYLTNWATAKLDVGGTIQISPTPTIVISTCSEHCSSKYSLGGSCQKGNGCGGFDEGRIYECGSPNICCCQ